MPNWKDYYVELERRRYEVERAYRHKSEIEHARRFASSAAPGEGQKDLHDVAVPRRMTVLRRLAGVLRLL